MKLELTSRGLAIRVGRWRAVLVWGWFPPYGWVEALR